jgi:hypothetical protein
MIFFTPDIGTLLRLEEDWVFTLYNEYRNKNLFLKLKEFGKIKEIDKNQIVDLPKGLVIKVDRIYIKKGLSQYSSITFTVPKPINKSEKQEMPLNQEYCGSKFWVKLHECNGIEFSPVVGNKETFIEFQRIYQDIEREASEIFGLHKCTKMLASINKALGVGKNINNFKTHLRLDQFINLILSKLNNEEYLSNFLKERFKREIRDFKIRQII